MDEWTTVITEATTIGNGRGFYVPTYKKKLKSHTKYAVMFIELEKFTVKRAKCRYAYKEGIRNEVISTKHRAQAS